MKKIWSKTSLLFLNLMFITAIFLGFQTSTVYANPTTNDVFSNAPHGMKLKDYLGRQDEFSGGKTNSSKILYSDTSSYPSDIVQMMNATGGDQQIGSIWGAVDDTENGDGTITRKGNYFDLKKKQKVSVWIYMGDSTTSIDGMAFVLQNDPRKYDAISRFGASPKAGETLGVWGGTNSPRMATAEINPASGAIQKSVALELDTLFNNIIPSKSNKVDNSFDSGNAGDLKYPHIAWGYPGEESTYTPISYNANSYYIQMNHNKLANHPYITTYDGEDSATAQTAWRHFIVTYDPTDYPKEGKITYMSNDQYSDGTKKAYAYWDSKTFPIDLSKLNINSTDGKVLWGFTDSTGSATTSPADTGLVMESMPNVANVSTKMVMTDNTQKRDIPDLEKALSGSIGDNQLIKQKSTVYDHDKLSFKYDLNYDSGAYDTGDITTQIGLPLNVDYTPEDGQKIGELTYTDKDGNNKEQDITTANLGTAKNKDDKEIQVVNLTLNAMSSTNSHVKVEIFGKAQAPTSQTVSTTTVNGEHTSFRSDEYTGDDMSPQFIVNNDGLKLESTSDTNQTINLSGNAKISAEASYLLNSNFDDKGLSAHAIVDNKDAEDTWDTPTDTSKTSIDINRLISAENLTAGKHVIQVYVTDSNGKSSNMITYTVTVSSQEQLQIKKVDENDHELTGDVDGSTGVSLNLRARLSYLSGNDLDLKNKSLHIQYDGGTEKIMELSSETQVGGAPTINIKIPANTFDEGTHHVTMWLTDDENKDISSNVADYTINYQDKQLLLEAKTDTDISVHTNQAIITKNVFHYDNGDPLMNPKPTLRYKIKNTKDDGTVKESDFTDVSGFAMDKTDKETYNFDFMFTPIGGPAPAPGNLNEKNILEVGKNEITMQVLDGTEDNASTDAPSNTIKFTIYVPQISSTISYTKASGDLGSVLAGLTMKVPMDFDYPDKVAYPDGSMGRYLLTENDLKAVLVKIDGKDYNFENIPQGLKGSVETPYEMQTVVNIDDRFSPGVHTLDVRMRDPYNRLTNTLRYQINVVKEGALLDIGDYRFETVKPTPLGDDKGGYIKRDGEWYVGVDHYQTRWVLKAQASAMERQDESGNYTEPSDLALIFIDSDGDVEDLSEEQIIKTQKFKSPSPRGINVANEWNDDNGILLKDNGVPKRGEYQGTITWSLEETP